MVVGRLQQQSWIAQAWSVRSVVEVVAEELAEPAVGDGDHDQGDAQPGPVASSISRGNERNAKHASVPLRRVRPRRPEQAQACLPGPLIGGAVPTSSGVLVSRMLADQPSSASLVASSPGE